MGVSVSETKSSSEKYFKRLDKRREKYLQAAKLNPKRYRSNIRMMAIIAILVPMFVLCAIVGLLTYDVALMLNENREPNLSNGAKVALGLVIFSLFNALRLSAVPTEGIEIKAEDAPNLFNLIEEVRDSVDGPIVNHVFLSSDMNACITQPNKALKFWKTENHLTLGLPLLNLLNQEETKAVIAHEFGHFCAGDGKLGNYLYRGAMTIERLQDKYETDGATLLEIPLAFFVQHFGDRFIDRIFPLMREQEYAADAMAAKVTSPHHLASALIKLELGANYLQNVYWPNVRKSMLMSERPSIHPIQDNAVALASPANWQEGRRWINAGLLEENNYEDTHPALSRRLHALGVNAFYPQNLQEPASHLLGNLYTELSQHFDKTWQEENAESFSLHYEQGQAMQKRYQELIQKASLSPLSLEDTIELTEISNQISDKSTLYQNMNYLVTHHAQASEAWLYAGYKLLEDGQPQCVDYLKYAADLNTEALSNVHELMAQHYREMGNLEALKNLAA